MLAVDDGNACLAAGWPGWACWLPHYMVKTHLANGELVPLLEDWHLDAMPLYLAFPPNRHVSAKLRVFIDWVVELMPSMPVLDRRATVEGRNANPTSTAHSTSSSSAPAVSPVVPPRRRSMARRASRKVTPASVRASKPVAPSSATR